MSCHQAQATPQISDHLNTDLEVGACENTNPIFIGGETIFEVGGGQILEVKNGASVPILIRRRVCTKQEGVWGDVSPSEIGTFLKM